MVLRASRISGLNECHIVNALIEFLKNPPFWTLSEKRMCSQVAGFSGYISDMGEPRGVGLNPCPGLGAVSYPFWSGEEDLAEFGAYREHAETLFGSPKDFP